MLAVASNVVAPKFPVPVSVQRAPEPSVPCEGDISCDQPPGRYSLLVGLDALEIPPDGEPYPYESYDVTNEGSGVNPECGEVIRWFARIRPGG